MKTILIVVLLLCFTGCESQKHINTGKEQLESQGYTEVKFTGWDPLCCSDEDTFTTGFKAKDKFGNPVEGCICGGLLKGVTIRFK